MKSKKALIFLVTIITLACSYFVFLSGTSANVLRPNEPVMITTTTAALIEIDTEPGKIYIVERSFDMQETWDRPVNGVRGTGGRMSQQIPADGHPRAFFRVLDTGTVADLPRSGCDHRIVSRLPDFADSEFAGGNGAFFYDGSVQTNSSDHCLDLHVQFFSSYAQDTNLQIELLISPDGETWESAGVGDFHGKIASGARPPLTIFDAKIPAGSKYRFYEARTNDSLRGRQIKQWIEFR